MVSIDELDFPRGNQPSAARHSKISAKAEKTVAMEVDRDLFKNNADPSSDSLQKAADEEMLIGGKRKSLAMETSVGDVKKSKKQERDAPAISALKFKRITKGMSLLCAIKEIHDLELIVSLPSNLTGSVAITNISSEIKNQVEKIASSDTKSDASNFDEMENELPNLHSLFQIGQLVVATVLEINGSNEDDKKRKIELSLIPEDIYGGLKSQNLSQGFHLQASIKSVEDHGYSLNLGIPGVHGFLNHKNAQGFIKNCNREKQLVVGQLVSCVVVGVSGEGRVVSVSCATEDLKKTLLKDDADISLSLLRPGILVNAKVSRVQADGLWVKFAGVFEAPICWQHAIRKSDKLDISGLESMDLTKHYSKGEKLRARILFVQSSAMKTEIDSKYHVMLSVKPSIVAFEPIEFPEITIGQVLEGCVIQKVDPAVGLWTSIKSNQNVIGFVHISNVADQRIDSLEVKRYRVGSTHKARVVGFDRIDGIVQTALAPSIIKAAIIRYEDIKVGQVISDATILKIDPITNNVIVQLSDFGGVRAICHRTHLADVPLTHPERRFKVGSTVKARVLTVDANSKKVSVTFKKTLVNSTLPLLLSITDIRQMLNNGMPLWSFGVISSVKPFGLIVSFFDRIRGLVHISQISEERVENLQTIFKAGQIVRCRVMGINEDDTLKLSLLGSSAIEKMHPSVDSIEQIPGGTHIQYARITHVDTQQGYVLLVADDEKYPPIYLPFNNFSDYASLNQQFEKYARDNLIIRDLVVLRAEKKKFGKSSFNVLVACTQESVKRSMSQSALVKFPFCFENVAIGDVVCGSIQRIDDSVGIYIRFGNDMRALCMKRNVSDSFVKTLSDKYFTGQSIIAVVTTVDSEQKRITVSMKESELRSIMETRKQYVEFMSQKGHDFFAARNRLTTLIPQNSQFPDIKIGAVVENIRITQIIDGVGAIVQVLPNLNGFVAKDQFDGSIPPVDSKVTGRILDVDIEKGIADVCCRKSIVKLPKHTSKRPKDGFATVLLKKPSYMIMSLDSWPSLLGFALNDSSSLPSSKIFVRATESILDTGAILFLIDEKSSNRQLAKENTTSAAAFHDLAVGMSVKGTIKSIKPTQMNIVLAQGKGEPTATAVHGRVHMSEVISTIEEIPMERRKMNIFQAMNYKQGSIVDLNVIGLHDAKTHKWLPISHVGGTRTVVEFSAKTKGTVNLPVELSDLTIGNDYVAYIQQHVNQPSRYAFWAQIGTQIRVRIPLLEVSSDPKILSSAENEFPIGSAIICRIFEIDQEKKLAFASIRAVSDKMPVIQTISDLQPNQILSGRILKSDEKTGVHVQLSSMSSVVGRVALTDISDDYTEQPTIPYRIGDFIKCAVIAVDCENNRIDLSLRHSHLSSVEESKIIDKEINASGDIAKNDIVRGYVKNIGDGGCFVSLGRNVNARVQISRLSDSFVKEWKKIVKVGQLVRGRVLDVDHVNNRIEMSLKQSDVDPDLFKSANLEGKLSISSAENGQTITGAVVRVESYGIFVDIDNSNDDKKMGKPLRGLCHRSELADQIINDIDSLYAVGDRVKAIILSTDSAKNQVSLGMKDSYFSDNDHENLEAHEQIHSMDTDDTSSSSSSACEMSDNDAEDSRQNKQLTDSNPVFVPNTRGFSDDVAKPLVVDGSFRWDGDWEDSYTHDGNTSESDGESSNDSELDVEENHIGGKSRSKRDKAREKRELEAQIRRKEQAALLGQPQLPETAEDFDRLLLASPNSSFLWIQYMVFYVNVANFDKARQVAERALKTISFREEQEKFNIWIAYMNLEGRFGTPESMKQIVDRAASYNEPKHIYLALAKIYEKLGKTEETVETYKYAIKKFRQSCKVWLQMGFYYYNHRNLDAARAVLQPAIQSLPKHKHVKIVSKFAQLEFKYGDSERGRTIFEGLMSNYPKRVDLWSIYLDQEIKRKEVAAARRLFERVIAMKFSSKKMKFFFKKYLDFEKNFGNEETVNHVVDAVRAYVGNADSNDPEN